MTWSAGARHRLGRTPDLSCLIALDITPPLGVVRCRRRRISTNRPRRAAGAEWPHFKLRRGVPVRSYLPFAGSGADRIKIFADGARRARPPAGRTSASRPAPCSRIRSTSTLVAIRVAHVAHALVHKDPMRSPEVRSRRRDILQASSSADWRCLDAALPLLVLVDDRDAGWPGRRWSSAHPAARPPWSDLGLVRSASA